MRISADDPNFDSALVRHVLALEREPARHNLILGLLERTRALQSVDARLWSFATPGSCAFQMGSRNIVLGEIAAHDIEPMANELLDIAFQGIVGPGDAAGRLVEAFVRQGLVFAPPIRQGIHQLVQPPRYPGAAGQARELEEADRELFLDFTLAFYREALPHDIVPPPERIGADVTSGRHLFWVVDGAPVSLASNVRGTATLAAIGGVFTPPAERGKGYAGSVTAALCDRIFASGRKLVCLYTDLSNPYSNRCYAKIGFQPVCEAFHYVRKPS